MFSGKARKPITLLVKVVQEHGETQEDYLILEADTKMTDVLEIALRQLRQKKKITMNKEENYVLKGK